VLRKSGTSSKNESCPLSDVISTNPTSLPIALSAITISLFSDVGYSQADVKDMIKNFVSLFSIAYDKLPPNFFVKSK